MAEQEQPIYSPFFGVMGATSAMVFSAMGAAYGTAKSGNLKNFKNLETFSENSNYGRES